MMSMKIFLIRLFWSWSENEKFLNMHILYYEIKIICRRIRLKISGKTVLGWIEMILIGLRYIDIILNAL